MPRTTDLFRPEALEDHTGPGRLAHATAGAGRGVERWVGLLLLVPFLATALAASVRIDRQVAGPARLDAATGRFVVLLPVDVETAGIDTIRFDGRTVGVHGLQVTPADDATVARAGFASPLHEAVLVTGSFSAGGADHPVTAGPDGTAKAVIRLGSEALLGVLLRSLGRD